MTVTDINKYSLEALRKDNERQEHLITQLMVTQTQLQNTISSLQDRVTELLSAKRVLESALEAYQQIEEDRFR